MKRKDGEEKATTRKKLKGRGLDIRKVPVPANSEHPDPPHGYGLLPRHEFVTALFAPKGGGKTNTIINMLEFYKDYFHEIYVFSPSITSDVKWRYAKNLDLLIPNERLQAIVKHHEEKPTGIVQDRPLPDKIRALVDFTKKHDPKIPKENFFDNYDEKIFRSIMDKNRELVDLLDKHGYNKADANRILVIIDDPVGMNVYSNSRNNFYKGFNTRHRHYSASILCVSQGFKEMPSTVRTNLTSALVYEIGNMAELEKIYVELQMGLTWDEWYEAYKEATKEPFNFLFLDNYGPKHMRIRRNFDKALLYVNKEEDEV